MIEPDRAVRFDRAG